MSYIIIHHILLALHMHCKGCYRISIVLAFSVFMWTGENDSNTLSVDGSLRFRKYPDTCGQSLGGLCLSGPLFRTFGKRYQEMICLSSPPAPPLPSPPLPFPPTLTKKVFLMISLFFDPCKQMLWNMRQWRYYLVSQRRTEIISLTFKMSSKEWISNLPSNYRGVVSSFKCLSLELRL